MNRIVVDPCYLLQDQFLRKRKDYNFDSKKKEKELDHKVKGVVLEKILSQDAGSLFVSSISPQVLLQILSSWPSDQKQVKKPSPRHSKRVFPSKNLYKQPLGIKLQTSTNWLNAILQFIIFIPSLKEMFNFVPKSLNVFAEFIDQYLKDSIEQHDTTLASTSTLYERLKARFPNLDWLNMAKWDTPIEFLKLIMRLILDNYPNHYLPFLEEGNSALEKNLESIIQSRMDPKLLSLFSELFICRKDFPPKISMPLQRQLFFSHSLYLELDAFVEYRPDGSENGSYLTYIKQGGVWYQCDDHRVAVLTPSTLPVAMLRGVIFHYKHIKLAKYYDSARLLST